MDEKDDTFHVVHSRSMARRLTTTTGQLHVAKHDVPDWMTKTRPSKDCPVCLAPECDCLCRTCEAARQRRKAKT